MGWTARPSVHWINPVIAGGMYAPPATVRTTEIKLLTSPHRFGFAQIGITMSVFVYFADLFTVNVGAVFAGMKCVLAPR